MFDTTLDELLEPEALIYVAVYVVFVLAALIAVRHEDPRIRQVSCTFCGETIRCARASKRRDKS